MKRLFAALKIYPDADFLKTYRKLKADLYHEPIKWVEESNIHITLKFFGETDERRISVISSGLGKRAGSTASFQLQLAGLGIFGSSYAPRVIWVGIEPFDELSLLMKNIQNDLAAVGFEADRQNLVPHLTLGRIKSLHDKILFGRTLDKFRNIASAPAAIEEVILYESILHREGPEYIALDRYPLKKELP